MRVRKRALVSVFAHKGGRESGPDKGKRRLSAGPMNFRPIYLMNESLEGFHPQTVP